MNPGCPPGILLPMNPSDALQARTRAELLALLEVQHHQLRQLVDELGAEVAGLAPGLGQTEWQGPARWAYDRALDVARETLILSIAALGNARDATSVAIGTVAADG
ncbi:MAG: hypothetical protein JWR53_1170 [Glaciihabitans sp.]|nr:hypothetical protein [Glaciihabitans sp.]